ncbi:MAG: tetratricopeptide repeat protein [Deltaproteobacteria bacterium]|nr:tetratricopeptide repeat protein [Deltaproteobacteria bacterium]
MTRTMWTAALVLGALSVAGAAAAAEKDKKAPASRRGEKDSAEAKRLADEEAEKARKERESRVPEVVKEEVRKKDAAQVQGPRISVEQFRRRTEFQVQKKRDEQVQSLDQIIKLGPPPEEMPAILFQKAELFEENSQHFFFSGMELDDDIVAAREAGDTKKQKQVEKQKEELLGKAKKWSADADLIFEEIIKKYKKFERLDQVMYALGRSRWDGGKHKEALEVFRELIQTFPKSPFVADGYLAFGEYHFENKKIDNALQAYQKAAAFEESKVYGYAVYKQGWCYYNQTSWENAAEKFKEVILYSQLDTDKLGDKKIMLTKEARKDYVTVYSHFGDPAKAFDDFKTLADGDDYKAMIERLANLYYGEGQDREAAVVYRLMINADKDNTRNPFNQGRIVSCVSRMGNKKAVVKQARLLTDEFQRVRAHVAAMDPKDPKRQKVEADLRDAEDLSDNTLRSLATTWHNEARKTRDDETYELAYELYGDYLELFPDKKPAYDIRFFYAELNYKLEKFEKAAEQYAKVLEIDPKGKWGEAAAEEAVRAYDELMQEWEKKQKKAQKTTDSDPTKPQPIPETKQKLVTACENYLKYFSKPKIAVECNYKIARIKYDSNIFDEAVAGFNKVIDGAPEHPRAEQAANLVLDVHNLREDWDALYGAARGFQKNKPLMAKEEFAKNISEVLESSSFKVIGKLQRNGRYEDAAKAYLSFADEFRKSTLADKALANAAANFQLAGKTDKAVRTREALVTNFPDSPLVPDALFSVAEAHEQVAELDKAAEALERFYKKYPQDPRSKDALFNAGIYREGYGGGNNLKTAVEDREKYLKDYPKSKEGAAVAMSICRLYEQSKNWQKAVECLEQYAMKYYKDDPEKAWDARFKAVDMQRARGAKKGDEILEKLALEYRKKHKRLPEGSNSAARVAFMDAEVKYAEYRKVKLETPDLKKKDKFKNAIKEKAKGRDAVRKFYMDVVRLKDPEYAIAALYRIADLNLHYMNALRSVPPPRELTPDQKQIFKDQLADNAAPIEEEAVGAFKLCIQKSQELHVFNQWSQKCLDVLEEKRPDEFPKLAVEKMPVPPVPPPQPHFLVVELPKEGADLAAVAPPAAPLVPKAEAKPESEEKPKEGEGGAGGGGP